MVDWQDAPSGDGLDQLFGASAFSGLTPSNPSSAAPTRRELREQPRSRSRSRAKRGRSAAAPPPPFVRPIDSAYPASRVIVVRQAPRTVRKKKRGSGFVTILAVAGLFASVALPAYAFVPTGADLVSADSSSSSAAALAVAETAAVETTDRATFGATTAAELRRQTRTALTAANYAAYMASGALEMGDDYPWFSELSNNQGGGLSPLNYFYRECVDFVAWRLNRDAGTYTAPYKWVWSNLTPTGGNASQWKYAWLKKGWPTGTTPVVGAVAWFPYNHVAYVKAINGDGTILIEEYNWEGKHLYGQRTIPATSVSLYLYHPPG